MNSPLLPPLNEKSRVAPGEQGKWQPQQGIAYSEVADSLSRPDIGTDTKSISSIPDMWARPLLVDMVLRDSDHPLHGAIKAQWKGMLAAIALADVKRLNLKAQLLDLEKLKSDSFVNALWDLCPSAKKVAYQSTETRKGGKPRNPWEILYVFLLDGQPVGMTSPATLICPSEQGNWEGVPWYDEGRLQSPLDSSEYLTEDDKIQLWLWLEDLRKQLNKETGDSTKLKAIITEYQKELNVESGSQNLRSVNNPQFFGVPVTLGTIKALNTPIKAQEKKSSVKLRWLGKPATEEVLFIPQMEELLEQWETQTLKAKDIWIYKTTSAAIFNQSEFEKQIRGKNVKYLTEDDIFAPSFHYLEGEGNLPGALLPQGLEEITYTVNEEEKHLTPLLPLKAEILKYFTPEELINRIAFYPTTLGNQSGVSVSLTLPLSGGDFTIRKDYSIEPSHAIKAQPFLEIWPNFTAPNWKTYYAFYFDDRVGDDRQKTIFRAIFPNNAEVHPEDSDFENFQMTRLESFPDYIVCQSETGQFQGLILLKTPPTVGNQNPNKTWTVGVDFGTSFTNVYYNINKVRNNLTLNPLHLQVTQTEETSRTILLYNYFMSADPEMLPLSSVLTIKGTNGQERPILDGRIYIAEDVREFDPNQDDIKTDLKWKPENIPYNRTFLKHLALMIAAEAAQNHVKKINWSISYPSAFSRTDKNLYKVTWQRIIEDLGKTTGIDHQWLTKGNPYRAESLALAHYFADEEGKDLVYTTCIDMGGGTSDISIWLGNR